MACPSQHAVLSNHPRLAPLYDIKKTVVTLKDLGYVGGHRLNRVHFSRVHLVDSSTLNEAALTWLNGPYARSHSN